MLVFMYLNIYVAYFYDLAVVPKHGYLVTLKGMP